MAIFKNKKVKNHIDLNLSKKDKIAKKKSVNKGKYNNNIDHSKNIVDTSTHIHHHTHAIELNAEEKEEINNIISQQDRYEEYFIEGKVITKDRKTGRIIALRMSDAIKEKLESIINDGFDPSIGPALEKRAYELSQNLSKEDFYYIVFTYILYLGALHQSRNGDFKAIAFLENIPKNKIEEINTHLNQFGDQVKYIDNFSNTRAYQYLEGLGIYRFVPKLSCGAMYRTNGAVEKKIIELFPWYKSSICDEIMSFSKTQIIKLLFNIWIKK